MIEFKIQCSRCNTCYHVDGSPVRGQFHYAATKQGGWIMNEVPNMGVLEAYQRWFWHCPVCCTKGCIDTPEKRDIKIGCPSTLEYYFAEAICQTN